MRVYVLSCPRSGTWWMTDYLKQNGIEVEHEKPGPQGAVGWNAQDYIKPGSIVLHQVRDPLKTINSLSCLNFRTWALFARMGVNLSGELIDQCARLWWAWNQNCEAKSQLTFRIEDPPWHKLQELLGVELKGPKPSSTRNTRKHIEWTWDDLKQANPKLAERVIKLATRYGYQEEVNDGNQAHSGRRPQVQPEVLEFEPAQHGRGRKQHRQTRHGKG